MMLSKRLVADISISKRDEYEAGSNEDWKAKSESEKVKLVLCRNGT